MQSVRIQYELTVKGETESKIENTYIGKKDGNSITYKEGNIDVCLLFLEDEIVMQRRNEEYEIEMPFKKDGICAGKYEVSDIKASMDLLVTTEKLDVQEGHLEIMYTLLLNEEDLGEFDFKLEYEVEV